MARSRLAVKVVAGAASDGIAGWLGDTLKVRVRAPAERGRANAAVESLLAGLLGVPAEDARIVAGRTSTRKIVEVDGLAQEEVVRRLSKETK
jgi:uncharacterized protein YggU (UPF0235/DUF167 family)